MFAISLFGGLRGFDEVVRFRSTRRRPPTEGWGGVSVSYPSPCQLFTMKFLLNFFKLFELSSKNWQHFYYQFLETLTGRGVSRVNYEVPRLSKFHEDARRCSKDFQQVWYELEMFKVCRDDMPCEVARYP